MFSCHYRWTDGMLHTRFPLTHMYICVSTGLFVNLLMCFYLHIDRCWGEPLRSPGKKQIDAHSTTHADWNHNLPERQLEFKHYINKWLSIPHHLASIEYPKSMHVRNPQP